jgi:hypothetical protein
VRDLLEPRQSVSAVTPVGCEYGDLERMVSQQGVEGALSALYRCGVYLSVDEFKGRRPVVRGSTRRWVRPAGLRNPRSTAHVWAQTSGSRGATTVVPIDLAFIRDTAANLLLDLAARDGADWLHAVWGVPGGTAMANLLTFRCFSTRSMRWFSQVDPAALGLHPRYLWSARAMRWASLLVGRPLPSPQYVPLQDPLAIARWMAGVLRLGGTPHLYTFASTGVRLCQAAQDAGLDIRGAWLTVVGEPVTAARLAAIRRAGASALPRYGSVETGPLGYGCLVPEASDDVHLFHDLVALVRLDPDEGVPGLPAGALLSSSIRPTLPLILLNVSLGDQAIMGRRACGWGAASATRKSCRWSAGYSGGGGSVPGQHRRRIGARASDGAGLACCSWSARSRGPRVPARSCTCTRSARPLPQGARPTWR